MPLTKSDGTTFEYQHHYPAKKIDPGYAERFKACCVETDEEAFEILENFRGKAFAWDTETIGLDFDEPDFLVGFSISRDRKGESGFYFPLRHNVGKNLSWAVFEKFDEILTTAPNFVYNAPFDIMTMIVSGSKHWRDYKTNDVYVMTYLMDAGWARDGIEFVLDENGEKIPSYKKVDKFGEVVTIKDYKFNVPGNGLKFCERHYLGHIVPTFEETLGVKSNTVTFADLDPKHGCKYAAIDAAGTYQLAVTLYPKLIQECPRVLINDLELARLFPRILMNKVHFNKDEMRAMYLECKREYESLTRGIFKTIGYPFMVSSPVEMSEALAHVGIQTGKKNKNGTQSTSKKILQELKTGLVVQANNNSYYLNDALIKVASIPKQMDYMKKLMKSGWGRFNYNMCSQVTGRFSSGTGKRDNDYYVPLNYQNLTKPTPAFYKPEEYDGPDSILGYKFTLLSHDEYEYRKANKLPVVEAQSPVKNIRRAISVPDNDWLFVSRDYCQEELVVAAMISGEPVWEDAIRAGVDLHESTARKMFPEREYDKHLRKLCKACNFSLLYGASPAVFAQTAQIPLTTAEDLHKRFWDTMVMLKAFSERKWRECVDNGGTLYTIFGRPRRLASLIQSKDRKLIRDAEKAVMSMSVQGACADILRQALIMIFKNGGVADKWADDFKFVGMIHDETNVLIKKKNFYKVLEDHKKTMEQQIPGSDWVLQTSVEVGNSYGESFPFIEKDGILVPKTE